MKENILKEWALRHGWTEDRHGNMILNTTPKRRLKITRVSARFEWQLVRELYGKKEYAWLRLKSGFLRDITINAKDELVGLTVEGCQTGRSSTKTIPNLIEVERQ